MSEIQVASTTAEADPALPDTWLQRALLRRQLEESGELVSTGARFNSFI